MNKSKGWKGLVGSICLVWAMTFLILPAITHSFDSFKILADFIDESEIDPGQFYYTDVEIITHAETATRSTIEYFSEK